MSESSNLEFQIKTSIQKAKQLETEKKYEQAIQEYKTLIRNTSKIINLQPNNKQKYMNEIAFYALKFITLEQKVPNSPVSIYNNLLYQVKTLAQNAVKEENFQESYENYLKASNKLKALIEIESNPINIPTYRNKAKEYKTRGIKLRKLYGLKKIEDDDEENDDMNGMKEELKIKEDFISDLVQKKSIISEENENLKSSISVKTSEISNLEDKMVNLEKKIDDLERENIKLKEIEKNEVKKNFEIMELLKNKENECENLKQENKKEKSNNSNEKLEKENKQLKQQYDISQKNIQELNNKIINLTEKLKELKRK